MFRYLHHIATLLLLLGAAARLQADGIPVSTPAGLWEFDNSSNIGLATLGTNLTVVGANPVYAATKADDGGTSLGGVMTTVGGTANRLRMTYSLPANGGSTTLVNEYTLLFDIFSPSASRSSWRCLFQTSADNSNDGDYFIRNNNDQMGTAALGYSSTALNDTRWKRVVIVADLGSSFRVYVDGVLHYSHTSQAVDGRYSLFTTGPLLLFADDSNENAALNVGAVAMWGKTLSTAEITALGAAGAPIQGATIANQSPVITQGATFNMPGAALNGPAVNATLNVTDTESDAITWSVSTAAAHGTAGIATSSNSQAGISYTPEPGFTGVDTFQIKAADLGGFDTINMTVVVMDPNVLLWPEPAGLWEYDFSVAPTLATTGANLDTQGSSFTSVTGAFADDGAQQAEVASHYRVTNPVGANGGGSYSNRYTLLWDVFIPSASFGGWKTLLQTSSANTNDGDLFINTAGQIGTAAGFNGYTTNALKPGAWHRVVMKVVNGTTNGTTLWVDGQKWLTTTTTGGVDGRYGLEDQFLILADDDGEDGQIQISNFAIWDDALGDTEITALSGVTRRVTTKAKPDVNFPPVITEGATTALAAEMNTATPVTLNVTDADNDNIIWTISGAPGHGAAVVTTSSNAQATITYTPTTSYNGPDSFTVQAGDGTATDSIVVNVTVQNSAPVISEGASYNLSATKNGAARAVTFHAVDPNGNPLTWSVFPAAEHGTATITESSNTEATVSYTPQADHTGPDSFAVSVTDGALSDSIAVNVIVSDPAANPKLTIVAAHGTATPAAGAYSHPRGTALTNSVTDEATATTRHLCTGWTMTGDGPATGSASTMNMTLTRDSILTWNFRTEHRVETGVSGGGTVSAASGWYEAGRPLQITATPAAGYYFVGWTGDTSGCQTGGKSIVVPMDRPRTTITATFAVNEDFVVIALPDTQNYTSISSPSDLYTRQTQWILDNTETMNIKFVTHLGDLVNSPSSQSQWLRCTDAMNLMNNRMPYGTCPGNHDLATGDTNYITRFGPTPTHSSSIGRWVDPDNSQTYHWYRGASPRGYSSYQIVTVNGRDHMFMHLDMDTPDQDLAWAAGVLAAHPKTLTMVTTHNYLAESGGSGIYGSGTGQRGRTAQANISIGPDRNRPLDVFNAVVKPFNQVYMVICGHNFATYNIQATNDAGKQVHEVLVDYQSLPNGGNGFLRIMEFRPQQNQIVNTSYSPYLGRYVDPGNNADHQGMLDLHDRNGSEFILATDFDTRFNMDLTVVSAHGSVTPAVGTHSIETGTPVAISATEQVVGQTRYRPTGWALAGGQTASGTGSSAVITQGAAAATLTWSYATEHYLTISAVGSGIASTTSGWHTAGAAVSIQAQPDAGATFIQWSGDISGCTIEGANISVPMDRPRGPITAEFSSPLPTYSVQVVSAYPGVTPAAATYTYEQGQNVTFSAVDIAGADTRRVCTGYSVTGGVTQSGTEKSFTLPITGNMTVTWNWTTQYLLATAASGPGTVSTGSGAWVDENTATSVTATASTGAAFATWSGDTALGAAAGNVFNIPSMTRPVATLTANFLAGMHTLSVVSSQATTTPAPGAHPYAFGTTVEFSALTAESNGTRQRPSGWALNGASSGSGSGTSGSFVVQGDTTLTWTYEPEVLLSITGGAEGIVLPMNAAGWHPLGSSVSLQASATTASFTFKSWTGDVPAGSVNPSLTLIMSQPRSITADFTTATTADGTPNWWLNTFAKVTGGDYEAARLADSDGDGLSAWEEFVAGTSDLDGGASFQVNAVAPFSGPSGTALNFTLPMMEGRLYQLMETTTLGGAFTPVGPPVAPTPPEGVVSIQMPTGVASHFYSIQVVLAGTSGRDGDRAAASSAPLPDAMVRSMVPIPGGSFIQGEDSGPVTTRPEHVTHVSRFMMDKLEVTRADWEAVATWAQTHGYDIPVVLRYNQAPYNVPADHPAVAVSWYDAVKWCNARSEMEGRRPVYFADTSATALYRTGEIDLTSAHVNWSGDGYRLPTEAEWERASRGGLEQKPYAWGDAPSDPRANHWDYQVIQGRAPNGPYPYTERAGFFDGTQPGGAPDMANAYGLYDMAGNAWEWTWDRMGDYTADKQYDPHGGSAGTQRVQRGGSWWNYIDQATNYQRLPFPPDGSDDYGMIGFRCVRAMHPNE